jgi:hypothetical protein
MTWPLRWAVNPMESSFAETYPFISNLFVSLFLIVDTL